MKHLPALLVKLAFVLVLTAVVLMPMEGATFSQVIGVSLVLTLALYAVGDMVILPAWGNMAAVIADAVVTLFVVWLAPYYTGLARVSFLSAVATAVLIGIAEYFFHNWLQSVLAGSPMGDMEGTSPADAVDRGGGENGT